MYGPVFKFRIFNYTNIIVTDPEAIKVYIKIKKGEHIKY